MRIYETLMILHPDITEEGVGSVLERIEGIFEQSNGKITEIDQWGIRKLAYRIAKQPRGYYTLIKYAAPPTVINELERNLKLWEECLRFLTVKLEDELDAESLESIERVHKKPTAAPEEEAEEEIIEEMAEDEENEEDEKEAEKPVEEEKEEAGQKPDEKILRDKGLYDGEEEE